MRHPNVVPIVDLGREGDRPFTVMDYIEGDTLAAAQRWAIAHNQSVPLGIALRVLLDALAGLHAAHELRGDDGIPLRVVHRDVAPQNILVGIDGLSRLADFGVARAASRLSITGRWLIKGRIGFIPAGLDTVLRRALAPDPARRYSTAAVFADALETALPRSIATQRDVAAFMSTVAADKVSAERSAVQEVALRGTSLRPRSSARPSAAPTHQLSAGRKPTDEALSDAATVTRPVHPAPVVVSRETTPPPRRSQRPSVRVPPPPPVLLLVLRP